MIRLLWKKTSDGAKIYRVYGTNGCLTVPQKIEGMPVYAIGAYCFSASNKLDGLEGIRETKWQESLELYCEKQYDCMVEAQPGPRDGVLIDTREVAQPAAAYLGEIAGNEVLQVVLPDTVVEIEELAFYNCRKLSVIEFGSALETIGSDVFMNCRSLKQLRVRADIRGKTGVKAVLSRIPWEIQVDFAGEETASLLYPEYTESYDEIAPAHIFGRNITGEGFRARQQFQDGIVQLAGYDAIYPKVIAEESPLTIAKMAYLRLQTPIGVQEDARKRYEEQLHQEAEVLALHYIDRKQLEPLHYLCEHRYLTGNALEHATQKALEDQWSEGASRLMEWNYQYGRNRRRERYAF